MNVIQVSCGCIPDEPFLTENGRKAILLYIDLAKKYEVEFDYAALEADIFNDKLQTALVEAVEEQLNASGGKYELRWWVVDEIEDLNVIEITWCVEDFKERARQLYNIAKDIDSDDEDDENWKEMYDESKMQNALQQMKKDHDCNNGITWDTVDFFLNYMCKQPGYEDK